MIYNYRAKDKKNKIVEGLVEAETEGIAEEILTEKGLMVLALTEKKKLRIFSEFSFTRVSEKELVVFSRQLAVMISADVSIVKSLQQLVRQIKNTKFKVVISEVANEVEGGVKLSDALGRYPKIFDNFFVNLIKSGENASRLEEVLNYLADQIEKDYDLKAKIKGALMYPAFIMVALVGIGVFALVFIIPKLTLMLAQNGGELPLTTQIISSISDFLRNYWWLVLFSLISLIVFIKVWGKTYGGRKFLDTLKLKIPIFNKIFTYVYVVRFSRSLRTLAVGGVDFVESLKIVSDVVGNLVYKEIIDQAVLEVEDGSSLSTVLFEQKTIPQLVSQMIATGEQTSNMKKVLEKVADFYTRELTNLINNLMSLMEPIIMVVLGLAVGVMVAAVIMPMYNLATTY